MGADAESVSTIAAFEAAFARAKKAERTFVIEIKTDPYAWSDASHAWWEVGTPQISDRSKIRDASAAMDQARKLQRRGV